MDNKIKEFKKLRIRRMKLLAELRFLVWCRNVRLFPKSLAVKAKTASIRVRRATVNANLRLLRAHIKDKRTLIESEEFAMYLLHMELAKKLNPREWKVLDASTYVAAKRASVNKEMMLLKRRWDLVHHNNAINNAKACWKVTFAKRQQMAPGAYSSDDLRRLNFGTSKLPDPVQNTLEELGIFRMPVNINPQIPTPKDVPPKLGMPLVNLSSAKLDQRHQELLKKGPKFALGPGSDAGSLFVSSVEKALSSVPEPRRTLLRTEIITKCQHSNLEVSAHWKVFRELKKMNVVYLKADKGETVVLMDRVDFEQRVETELRGGTYTSLKKDPTATTVTKLNKLLKTFSDQNLINSKVPNPVAPRLFAQVKLHKEGRPLRLIVSARNSPLCKLEKGVARILGKYAYCSVSCLKNSEQLVCILEATTPPSQDESLVSLDIVQLFPNLPREETIEAVAYVLDEDGVHSSLKTDIVAAVKFVFEHSYFRYAGKFFRQNKGSPIGSSLSPVLAEIFLQEHEKRAKASLYFWPRMFLRYVDDHLVVVQKDKLNMFVQHLNSVCNDICYTVEHSVGGTIAFLDVSIESSNGKFLTKVHRKPTSSGVLIHFNSMHHPSHKYNTWATLVHRAFTLCNDERALMSELDNLKELASLNGFHHSIVEQAVAKYRAKKRRMTNTTLYRKDEFKPDDFVVLPYLGKISQMIGDSIKVATGKRLVFRPLNKLGMCLFNTKDPIQTNESSGVYKVSCNCGSVYVGQTKRNFGTRLKEHKAAVRNFLPSNSAIARHFWLKGCDQGIKWDDSRVVIPINDHFLLKFCEALEISLVQAYSPDKLMNDQERLDHLVLWAKVGCKWLRPTSLTRTANAKLANNQDGLFQLMDNHSVEAKKEHKAAPATQSLLQVHSLALLQSTGRATEEEEPPPPVEARNPGSRSCKQGRMTFFRDCMMEQFAASDSLARGVGSLCSKVVCSLDFAIEDVGGPHETSACIAV